MKKSRTVISLLAIFLITLTIYFYYKKYFAIELETKAEVDDYDKNIELVMKQVPTEILVYGKDISFRDSVKYKHVNEINQKVFDTDKEYVFLIINDLEVDSGIDKENLKILRELLEKNNKANLIYLGTKRLDELQNLGFFKEKPSEDVMSFSYVVYQGYRIEGWGLWTRTEEKYKNINPELLGESIIMECADDIKSNQ